MANIKQEMQDVIARLVEEIKANAQRKGRPAVKLAPHPPATVKELDAYEKYLDLELPKSYRAFLELHNGYDKLAYPGDMLSTRAVMPRGEWYDRIQNWKKMSAQYGMGEVLEAVVIANLDSSVNWAFIDPNRRSSKDEFVMRRWLNGDADDYKNLIDFFEGRIRFCRVDLKAKSRKKAR